MGHSAFSHGIRPANDGVTTLGCGVDGTVRRISSAYEMRGVRESVTSYVSAFRPTTMVYPNDRASRMGVTAAIQWRMDNREYSV